MATAVQDQETILKELIKVGKTTEFGKEHRTSTKLITTRIQTGSPSRIMSIQTYIEK